MELPELDASAFQPLIDHLSKKNIAMNKYRKNSGLGRSVTFGMVRKRSMAPDLARNSWMDARLHYLLMKFALVNLPSDFTFTSIQVNESYKCEAHFDKHNRGNSYIVAFGSFTDGELVLKEVGGDKAYNIRHRPVLFDGSVVEHYTKEFTGRRWSIVYHTLVSPPKFPMVRQLQDYEAVVRDGTWVIAWHKDGEPTVYLSKKNGLDHPLKGRKKVVPAKPLVEDSGMSEAQNFMIQHIKDREEEENWGEDEYSEGEV